MLKSIQSFFNLQIENESTGGKHDDHALRLATAALLFEVSRADFKIVDSERKAVESAIQKVFSLTRAETRELADLAEQEVEHSVSLYEFTGLINQHFSSVEKVRMIEMLWQVVFADGYLASYEEAMVRKIAELIYVPHREFIQAKHRVENTLKQA